MARGGSWAYRVVTRLPGGVIRRAQATAERAPRSRRILRLLSAPLRSGAHPIAAGPARGLLLDAAGSRPSYVLGTAEPQLQTLLRAHLRPGDTLYDLGANVGYFTLVGASLVGPTGHVVAFEPSARNAAALRRNVAMNNLTQVVVREMAVSDSVGLAGFCPGDNDQSGTLGAGPCTVATTTIDHEVRGTGCIPDVLKIDVEGAEDRVLAGAARTLAEHRPLVVCELHVDMASLDHPVPVSLAALGYDLSWLEGPQIDGARCWAPHVVAVPSVRRRRLG